MSSASDKAACFRDGAFLSNLIHVATLAAREDNLEAVGEAVDVMREVVRESDCLAVAVKEKVSNEIDALSSFLRQHDKEGIRQSMGALESDVAPPIAMKLPGGHPGKRIIGYQLKVDGKEVGRVLGRKQAAADFEAAMMLHPESRVEMEPVTS